MCKTSSLRKRGDPKYSEVERKEKQKRRQTC